MLDHVTVFAFVISKSQLIAQPPRPHQQYRRILHVRIFVVEIAALSAALLRVLVGVFFLGLKHLRLQRSICTEIAAAALYTQ